VACLLNQGVQRLVQCFLLFVLVLSHRRFVLGGAPSHKLSDRLLRPACDLSHNAVIGHPRCGG
jgi:hypothetical protein